MERTTVPLLNHPSPTAAVVDARDAACAAAAAAEEAGNAAILAEKKAAEAVHLAAIAAHKASCAVDLQEFSVDYSTHARIRNSVRYAIQEMTRQTTMLKLLKDLCLHIDGTEGSKMHKVVDHVDHIRKQLEKTTIVCQNDLDTKHFSDDIDGVELDSTPDSEDLKQEDVSEDEELWEDIFLDQKYRENLEPTSMADHCREMGWNFEEWWDRTM